MLLATCTSSRWQGSGYAIMLLLVCHQLLLLGIEKEWLDWVEYIAVTMANVGHLLFVNGDGAKVNNNGFGCLHVFIY